MTRDELQTALTDYCNACFDCGEAEEAEEITLTANRCKELRAVIDAEINRLQADNAIMREALNSVMGAIKDIAEKL